MDSTLETFLAGTGPDTFEYRPTIYRLPADEAALKSLVKSRPGIQVSDHIHAQVRELIKSLNPSIKFITESLESAISKHLAYSKLSEYGSWIFYPWSDRLVHLLDEDEFAMVRTDRNRNKITREEQAVLATKKIGVIGLSVGQSVSMTMALERCFGEIRLADFDTLDLSNLNRIRSGTHSLGSNKAIVTAREIAELDPYLKVVCFTEGLTRENMDAFFTEGGKLDILVEECDSVEIKILARQKAKALGIPVVMDTSDRGCLDVERFDLEPERPILHGWIDHLDLDAASKPMSAEERVPYMLPITGVETLSPRMKASVLELGSTISTWPQLATSVILGGAVASDVVRRIALNEFHLSGRWHIDLDELVADPPTTVDPVTTSRPELKLGADDLDQIEHRLGEAPDDALELGQDLVNQLVEAGGMAPSSGNMQPWKFHWQGKRLFLFHDEGRSHSFWDPGQKAAHLALGACMENVVLKAHGLGLEVRTALFPDGHTPRLTALFEFQDLPSATTEKHATDELVAMIGLRCTNRNFSPPSKLPDGVSRRLEKITSTMPDCKLHLLDDEGKLSDLAELCGSASRIRTINPIGHQEFFQQQLRWSPEEARLTKDGLDLTTMVSGPTEIAALKMASDPRAMGLIDQWGAGKALGMRSAIFANSAAAMVLISHKDDTPSARLNAGRAMERLWMAANAEGLSVYPMPDPVLMPHVLGHEACELRDHERAELERIRDAFADIWPLNGRTPMFLLRLSVGGSPRARSIRRETKDLLLSTKRLPTQTPA